jgi:hypothetical protein
MPTWYDTSALDALLDTISGAQGGGATTVRLLNGYVQGDTFSEVNNNTIASEVINSSDFETIVPFNQHRRLTFKGKTATATLGATGADLHIALCSASVVLAVTDETSDQTITESNLVTFPAFYMQSSQPTQV